MAFIIGNTYVSSYSIELAIFFIVSTFISFLILHKLQFNLLKISHFFSSKPWPFMKNNSKLLIFSPILSIMLIFFIISPIFSLALWGLIVIKLENDFPSEFSPLFTNTTINGEIYERIAYYSNSHLAGKAIFLVSFSCFSLFFAAFLIKLSNYRLKSMGIFSVFFSICSFFAFQLIALLDDFSVSFYGITAIFFSLNGILMILLIFLMFSDKSASLIDIIKGFSIRNSSNSKNFDNIDDLINSELNDPNYDISQEEIFKMITFYHEIPQLQPTALGGGFLVIFRDFPIKIRFLSVISLYLIAIGVLLAYSFLIYHYSSNEYKNLGFLNLIMLGTCDLMIFLITRMKIMINPLEISLLMLSNRIFLYALAGDLWFIGYCSLYLLLNIALSEKIIENNWPLADFLIIKSGKNVDFSKKPEFVSFFSTVIFLVIMVVLALGNFKGIPIKGFEFADGSVFPFWAFGIASIFFIAVFFLFRISRRIYLRYSLKIKDLVFYYVFLIYIDSYYISVFGSYLGVILIGGLCFAMFKEPFPLIICCFLPVLYELVMVLSFNLRLNEYHFPADTERINKKMRKCREKIEAQSKKTIQIKEKTDVFIEKIEKNNDKINKNEKIIDDIENLLIEEKTQKMPIFVMDSKEANENHEGGPVDPEIWAKNGITKFVDWRELKISFVKAFVKNYLVPTDYKIIYSGLLFVLIDGGYCVASVLASDTYKLIGPSIGVAVFSAVCFFLPIICYLKTLKPINFNDIILIGMGAGANYGYGFFYFLNQKKDLYTDSGTYYLLFFVFVMPGAFLSIAGFLLWKENRYKLRKISIFLYFLLSVSHFFGLGVFLCIFVSFIAGGVIIALTFVLCLAVILFYKYNKNNKSLPKNWIISIIVLLFLCTGSSLVAALILSDMNDFIGYSIFILSFVMIVFMLALFLIKNDFALGNQQPIFFSPWVFPVFIYDLKSNSIRNRNLPYLIFFACLFTIFLWTVTVCIWVKPAMIGISIGSLIEVLIFLFFVNFSCFSSLNIGEFVHSDAFVQKAIKKAWLSAKKTFFLKQGVTDPDEILNYVFYQNQLEKSKRNLKENLKEFVINKKKDVKLRSDYKSLYHGYSICQEKFESEMSLLVHFLLELMVISFHTVRDEKMRLISFVQNDRIRLFHQKIFIILETEKTVEDKYAKIKRQYNNLDNEKKHIFDLLKKGYDEVKRKEKIEADTKNKAEEEAKKERMQSLKHLNQAAKIDWSKPLEEIPDCLEKYRKIVESYKSNGTVFEDLKFISNEKTLGEKLSPIVSGWKRPDPEAKIFKDGYNPLDIQQGTIGDCYFMSAISVIGDKFLKGCFYFDKLESQDTGCGAYILKFFVGENVVDVIIDDKFPVDKNGDWVFGRSADKSELWPQILEKAYAKLYGGYYSIIGGKVSYALSELSGGVADEINLNNVKNNPENFWKTLLAFSKQGYLLGAGSPENPQGDAAFSEEGIVQGHAYAVLNVRDLEEVKLIKLRNPHGRHGKEWTGDWSDISYKWTEKLKKKINDEFAEDGAFWMSIEDFLYEFKYLYVCRIFEEKFWGNVDPIHGEWKGGSAAGLPSKENPKAKIQNNPQYKIVVTKKSTAFITLVQKETVDTFKGKLPIFFMVQKENGKKIMLKNDEKLVGSSGPPTNLKAVGKEIDLVASSYPYSFTLMVASAFEGEKGTGSFFIRISCTDKAVKVEEII